MPPTPQAPDQNVPALVIVRHGQTEWSLAGRHTGRTDVPLTPAGEQQASTAGTLVQRVLAGRQPALVISSPRQRASRTAELAGFPPDLITEDAAEWDYGELEGLTSAEISWQWPDWSIWTGPVPGGEDAATVSSRLDRLLARASEPAGPVLIFSHGHASRCLTARWLAEPVTAGRHFRLDTGAVSALGYEHGRRVVLQWNLDKTISGLSG
ncbi:MAG: histidine phosphatase family protein [Jatrophihabitantaceae bacterium]